MRSVDLLIGTPRSKKQRTSTHLNAKNDRKNGAKSLMDLGSTAEQSLGERHVVKNLTVNLVHLHKSTGPEKESEHWTERLKDFTDAVRNIVLIVACAAFLLGGTHSVNKPKSPEPAQIETKHSDSNGQLNKSKELLGADQLVDIIHALERTSD